MDFMKIIQSLEELLYEVMTWLVFYPRTMWQAVRHPIRTLRYSDRELRDAPGQQYTDLLSPPLFLMITILLSHMAELASHQALPPAATTTIGKEIVASEQNLLIVRSILFAVYPLMFATARLRRQKQPLNRETLRAPFFAQCYIAAPAAFAIGIATILGRAHGLTFQIAGAVLSLLAIGWYLVVESIWLRVQTRIDRFAAYRAVFWTWLKASLLNGLISFVVLGS
jgi:hypothetical protein